MGPHGMYVEGVSLTSFRKSISVIPTVILSNMEVGRTFHKICRLNISAATRGT
jgi:hypothetical protein